MSDKKPAKVIEPGEFLKRAVALRLKLARVGTRRAVDNDDVDLKDADTALVRVTKEVLDSEELKKIRNHDIETRAAIRVASLPSFLGSGWYLVPQKSILSIDAYIEKRAEERKALVNELVEALPTLKDRSRERLGHLWREDEFPTPEVVRESCYVASKFVTFDTPASLAGISKALLNRELEKAQKEGLAVRDAAVALLRVEMQKAVDSLANAFTAGPSGRKRGLKPETLAKVTAALDAFQTRNIAQDEELQALVEQAKALVTGKDAKTVRTDEGIGQQLAVIQKNLGSLIEDGPSRTIDFEE